MTDTTRTGLVAAGIVFGSAALVAGVIALGGRTGGPTAGGKTSQAGVGPSLFGPSESSEGTTWSHKELIVHLRGKGLQFDTNSSSMGALHGPSLYFEKAGAARKGGVMLDEFIPQGGEMIWKDRVHVQLLESPQKAKDQAGALGRASYNWGRFQFVGDPAFLGEIRQSLGG